MKNNKHNKLHMTAIFIICGIILSAGTIYGEEPSVNLLNDLDAKAALDIANRWHEEGTNVLSYVDQRSIYFEFNNGDKAVVPLPEYSMVVAIAPYLTFTHDCTLHYTSACQSEMVDTPLKVFGTTKGGAVVVDGTYTTLSNGFIELWLPRNEEIELTIEAAGKKGSEIITTYDSSKTCITTLQLL